MLNVIYAECHKEILYAECCYAECYAEWLYAECCYDEWHYAECRSATVLPQHKAFVS
jgi:hypothetical protein